MSIFSSPQYKGAMRDHRKTKRADAEARAAVRAEALRSALRSALRRGLAQSAHGQVVDLGDFTQYATKEN